MVFVHFVGDAALESDSRKLRGAGQRHFDVAGAVFPKEGKLAPRERLDDAQFLGDDAGDAAYWRFFLLTCFPRARHGVSQVEALHGVGEVTHEIVAAKFAVCENFKAELLLLGQNTLDVAIFDGVQVIGILRVATARLQQFRRTKKAADVVGSVWCGHVRAPLSVLNDSGHDARDRVGAPPRLAESFMAISRTSAIFCARSFPRKRSVGPAIPTAATTRFSASRTGAATPLSPLSSS